MGLFLYFEPSLHHRKYIRGCVAIHEEDSFYDIHRFWELEIGQRD